MFINFVIGFIRFIIVIEGLTLMVFTIEEYFDYIH
jgi:hypothetical protein